jgi:CheY-like chemotaxis protein
MNRPSDPVLACPYCGRGLQWVPSRWFGRGCFACEQCGEFPDLRETAVPPGSASDGSEQAQPRIVPTPRDRPRVLLVDDSAEHRDLYALMLEPTATVITAARGEDALAIAVAEPLDAIVLDVLMPGMNGWEVCRRLKACSATRDIPVIMLTSLDSVEVTVPERLAGAVAVLMKPCPAERLALTIEGALQRQADHRARRNEN